MTLKALFPEAAISLHFELLHLFQTKMSFLPDPMQSELAIDYGGTEEKLFEYQKRLCTYVMQIATNEKICIATTSQIFNKQLRV